MNTPDTAKLTPGTLLENKWMIMELIGKGAMGEVYRAHQTNLKRDVAIKTISDDVLTEIGEDPEELAAAFGRFQREVQTMAQVRHPNILTIFDSGEVSDPDRENGSRITYLVEEYIPGNSLRFTICEDGLEDQPELYADWITKYFLPILDGVEILHTHKIVHRDLKPENIFLDGEVPKIGDFGLARSHRIKAVTGSVEMLGTLAYMSPEQCSDFKTAGYSTDIYALGKILFEAVHGTLTQKIVPFTSVSLDNPQTEFFSRMSHIIRKATAEDPELRYQTVQEIRSDIQKALESRNGRKATRQEGRNIHQATDEHVTPKKYKMLGIGVILAALLITTLGILYLRQNRENLPDTFESSYSDHQASLPGKDAVSVKQTQTPAKTIRGNDGSLMVLAGDQENSSHGRLFYLDREKISNFLFVEFLNTFKKNLSVKNGIVRYGETIVVYIGDGSSEEDRIIYQHDKFHLKNQADGDKPVMRVTFHGAHMYAAYYQKELLNAGQWLFAYQYFSQHPLPNNEPIQQDKKKTPEVTAMMESHMGISPEAETQKKEVLDQMGKKVREWVSIPQTQGNEASSESNHSPEPGIINAAEATNGKQPLKRLPWEAFDDVGFRTMIPVVNAQ